MSAAIQDRAVDANVGRPGGRRGLLRAADAMFIVRAVF
jgi:hypothetical protein